MDLCVVSAALSGVAADKRHCPAIPYTPEEYADEARRAHEAGATVVHLHARYPDGRPSHRVEEYEAITEAIRDAVPELIINFSTGAIGVPREERIDHVTQLAPDMAALNMGSMNYAKYSRDRKQFVFDHCFENTYETIGFFLRAMNDAGVRPECECFDSGHLAGAGPLIDMGLLEVPASFSLVVGVLGGSPATPEALRYLATLVPGESPWQVVGISRHQWEMVDTAAGLGGHVRVGLEDNFYLPDGSMASSNGDLVEEAIRRLESAGRVAATASQAREILGLKT
jgi:3-keto-5-aminohexanoate cleavage enzyme